MSAITQDSSDTAPAACMRPELLWAADGNRIDTEPPAVAVALQEDNPTGVIVPSAAGLQGRALTHHIHRAQRLLL